MATQIARVTEVMKQHPSLTAPQIAEKTGIPLNRIYVLRYKAKKAMQAKKDALKAKREARQVRVPVMKADLTDKLTSTQIKMLKQDLAEAQAEAKKFEAWCLDWRARCEEIIKERDTAQAEVLATRTIMQYLENRLVSLLKG